VNLTRTLESIINYAVEVTEPDKIILFGSMANGTDNVYSDVDLLIISDSTINKKEAAIRIRNFAHQYSLKTDVLIYSFSEFEKEQRTSYSFIKAAIESGKIIYEKY